MNEESPQVELTPMTGADFSEFEARVISGYAEESAAAGRVEESTALEWSRRQTNKLLPDGINTKDMFFLNIVSSREPGISLGSIWCGRDSGNREHAFIYDLFLHPEHRGKGIGTAAMTGLENYLRERGYSAIGLHVYAHNQTALGLYRKLGFRPVSYNFRKDL